MMGALDKVFSGKDDPQVGNKILVKFVGSMNKERLVTDEGNGLFKLRVQG
jgi:hypothetical protein